jgi:hypothetical protein
MIYSPDRLKTLVPLLTVVPVIDVLTNLIFCETVPLLNLAFELVPTAIYNAKIVVSELSPLLLDLAFDLLPISFDSIPVHVNLHRSVHGMTDSEHLGSAMVPFPAGNDGYRFNSMGGIAA